MKAAAEAAASVKAGRAKAMEALIEKARGRHGLPEELARRFMLASVLGSLLEKPGCTSRCADIDPSKKLEYFVAAGINSGFAMQRLAQYILGRRKMEGAYTFLPEAVATSKLDRLGGNINQGILELMFPIMATQVLNFGFTYDTLPQLLTRASELLKHTSRRDVDNLIMARDIGRRIDGIELPHTAHEHTIKNVFDYYKQDAEHEHQKGNTAQALRSLQFIDGFHDIQSMLYVTHGSSFERVTEKIQEAYGLFRNKHNNTEGTDALAADQSTICLYLYLSFTHHKEIIE